MLNTEFAAAVLEGIEGTLEELIGRVDPSDVRDRLTALQHETAAVRRSLEETVRAPTVNWPALKARAEYAGGAFGRRHRTGLTGRRSALAQDSF